MRVQLLPLTTQSSTLRFASDPINEPSEPVKPIKSASTSQPVENKSDTQEITGEKKSKTWLKTGAKALLSAFHIGAAIFILAVAPFLKAPIWVGVASVLGLQVFQSWLRRRYPNMILNSDNMKRVATPIVKHYSRTVNRGQKLLSKIPLIGKPLAKAYHFFAKHIRKVVKRGVRFLLETLLPNLSQMNQLPEGFWEKGFLHKVGYLGKILVKQSILMLCAPWQKLGPPIVAFFNAGEATDFAKIFDRKVSDTKEATNS